MAAYDIIGGVAPSTPDYRNIALDKFKKRIKNIGDYNEGLGPKRLAILKRLRELDDPNKKQRKRMRKLTKRHKGLKQDSRQDYRAIRRFFAQNPELLTTQVLGNLREVAGVANRPMDAMLQHLEPSPLFNNRPTPQREGEPQGGNPSMMRMIPGTLNPGNYMAPRMMPTYSLSNMTKTGSMYNTASGKRNQTTFKSLDPRSYLIQTMNKNPYYRNPQAPLTQKLGRVY